MSKIVVIYEDAPVHCVDIMNASDERILRIRPSSDGAVITVEIDLPVSLTFVELAELANALDRLARR